MIINILHMLDQHLVKSILQKVIYHHTSHMKMKYLYTPS